MCYAILKSFTASAMCALIDVIALSSQHTQGTVRQSLEAVSCRVHKKERKAADETRQD